MKARDEAKTKKAEKDEEEEEEEEQEEEVKTLPMAEDFERQKGEEEEMDEEEENEWIMTHFIKSYVIFMKIWGKKKLLAKANKPG